MLVDDEHLVVQVDHQQQVGDLDLLERRLVRSSGTGAGPRPARARAAARRALRRPARARARPAVRRRGSPAPLGRRLRAGAAGGVRPRAARRGSPSARDRRLRRRSAGGRAVDGQPPADERSAAPPRRRRRATHAQYRAVTPVTTPGDEQAQADEHQQSGSQDHAATLGLAGRAGAPPDARQGPRTSSGGPVAAQRGSRPASLTAVACWFCRLFAAGSAEPRLSRSRRCDSR